MTQRATEHATFDIERVYKTSAERVYRAWADPAAKAEWFGPGKISLDFRVGGREHFTEALPDGRIFGYDAQYQEIVPDQRIVYAYTVDFDKTRISASLVTVEISHAGDGARLLYTEQAVYLDGADTPADRERGTLEEFKRLDAALSGARAGD